MGKAKVRKDGTPLGNFCRRYQGHVSIVFVLSVLAARFSGLAPSFQLVATKMTSLSYPNSDGTYGNGFDDLYFIGFTAIAFVALRITLKAAIFDRIAAFGPCDQEKFTMQAWQFIYYLVAWVGGAWLYYHSDYFLNMPNMWIAYPQNRFMSPTFKCYYLFQVAFWVQMAFVTLIEKWQKDFVQMMAHHFITIGLSGCSYFFGFTRAGHVVLVEQDFADIFLPLAKMFKYFTEAADKGLTRVAGRVAHGAKHSSVGELTESEKELQACEKGTRPWAVARRRKTAAIHAIIEYAKESKDGATLAADKHRKRRLAVHGTICDVLFAVFTVAWIPTRHGFFFWIIHSAFFDADKIIGETGVLGWDPANGLFAVPGVTVNVFLVVLGVFQFLLILWLMDLIRAVHKALFGAKSITEMEGFDVHEADSDSDDDDEPTLDLGDKKDN